MRAKAESEGSRLEKSGKRGNMGVPCSQPIDAVYTWVDGSDPAWERRKQATLEALGPEAARLHPSATSAVRYKSRDELRYSLRSLERFAPFIRKVYLVTACQVPDWLDVQHPDLELIFHEDLFPDALHLPTFSSPAIECHLHRIRGLSEHFVYFNDDVMLARPTTPPDFFDDEGRCIVYLDQRGVVWDRTDENYDLPVNIAARNTSRPLEADFGYQIRKRVDHVPHALRRSVLEELWERYLKELDAVSRYPFRHPATVTPICCLAPHYALCTGAAVSVSERNSTYIKVKRKRWSSLKLASRLLRALYHRSSSTKFLSVNDSGALDDSRLTDAAIALFFRVYFPTRSRFERRSRRPGWVSGGPEAPPSAIRGAS